MSIGKLNHLFHRKYFYFLLCLTLIFTLILWISIPKKVPLIGSRSDYIYEPIPADTHHQIDRIESNNQDGIAELAISTPESSKHEGNVISLAIYMESQCPDTTGFIKRQLLPSWNKLSSTKRVNVTIVPFGKANCMQKDEDYECQCQHGENECDLNQMMNCVIDRFPDPDEHIPIIGCIQGGSNARTVYQHCLKGYRSANWLWNCFRSKYGRTLHAKAGNQTALIGEEFNFVPWVVLDGKRVVDAFYALEENLCKKLDSPKPSQCDNFA